MSKFSFILFFLLGCFALYGQTGEVMGRLVDAKTHEPLPFANVYINKTTVGTVTNDSGKFLLKKVPLGPAEIVFSFVGYTPAQQRIVVKEKNDLKIVSLNQDVEQLSEIEIKSSRDKAWEKQERKFEKIFLGTTSNCKILNPWAINFVNENGVIIATASQPIEIENKILGYHLYFQLKNFRYSASGYVIVGNVLFKELTTTVATEALAWKKNRERAYYGSTKHLMKSILDHRISKNGFSLYRERIKGKLRSHNFTLELQNNLAAYDTSAIVMPGPSIHEYRLLLKEKMEVHYDAGFSEKNYYTDINSPISWIEVRGGAVIVSGDGTILNPTDVAVSGEMAEARVSNMLPADYKPGSIVAIEVPKNISAIRLQEKPYLHTDKPYYYCGDQIWFSAYMKYRAPALMDTLSKVLYVDLMDSAKAVQHRIVKLDSGRGEGSFNLTKSIKPGNYVLCAYTQWMRNYGVDQFYYKPIKILSADEKVNLQGAEMIQNNQMQIGFDKTEYKKRDEVKMTLRLDTTETVEFVRGSFSVSITDESISVPINNPTIQTELEIAEPSKGMLSKFVYPIERGISISGIYQDEKGKGKKTKLTLLPETFESIYQVPTLVNGEFVLRDLSFYDTMRFGVQPKEGKIALISSSSPQLPEKWPTLELPVVPMTEPYVSPSGDTTASIVLKEVVVEQKKEKIKYEGSYAEPDFYIKGDDIETYQNLAAAIAAKIPAYKLISWSGHWYLIWARGEFTHGETPSEPVLYVDQAQVIEGPAGDRLVMINPAMVDHIEVKGMIGSNVGATGANGSIMVFTKRYTDPAFKGLPILKVKGFDRPQVFVLPDYKTSAAAKEDLRSTLYWNPRVNLTSKHPFREINFFTSDRVGAFRVVVEGLTSNGKKIHAEARLKVTD
ncbi:MAG: carboxypeptidase-like regulatory domain-containing protein [Bacteroidetes bacterium]|nr:carboxypeptidase-like regulatory domain-containing protein [Bacteroidota bacterium]